MRRATLCIGAVSVALLAGCGGDGDGGSDAADDLRGQLTSGESGLTDDQADCVIERLEDELDDDQIEELSQLEDIDTSDPQAFEEIDQEAVEALFTASLECATEDLETGN